MYSWIFSISIALADSGCAPVDRNGWIQDVRERGREDAYLCLAAADDARTSLIEAIAAVEEPGSGRQRRLQRALALHVMQRLEEPANPDALRVINASDRRLLRDAVHARRGRASPVADHAAVFEKFDWYHPDPRFTNRSLTALDEANLKAIDRPPREPSTTAAGSAPAIEAMPPGTGPAPRPANTAGGCACASPQAPDGSSWLLIALVGLVAGRARSSTVGQSLGWPSP